MSNAIASEKSSAKCRTSRLFPVGIMDAATPSQERSSSQSRRRSDEIQKGKRMKVVRQTIHICRMPFVGILAVSPRKYGFCDKESNWSHFLIACFLE